jgi:glycosyltransferase involved in cell wall biosynthesis
VSDRILSGFESTERRNVERVVPGVSWKWTENTPVRNEREVPVIGWCGQRRGVTKGYDEVLVPVMEKLGDSVEWEINSRDHTNALGEEEMIRWYDDIDIFLSTSSSEGYQMPALEAMSRGRMVIATDAGGAGELISASAGGVLVDSWSNRKDAIPVVGQICDTITHNWENRHQFGDLGYDYVRLHQSWETLAEEWLEEIVF